MRRNGPALSHDCFRIGVRCRLSAIFWATFATLFLSIAVDARAAAQVKPATAVLGQAMVPLNGPWMFRIGDDPGWALPGFDDSNWEHVDLTSSPGATDGDVGIGNYVPGWPAKGHPRYHGFAWYRIRLNVRPPQGEELALLGPWAVDSAYQIYANGILLGGVGGFSGATPEAYSTHYPMMFALPLQIATGGPIVIAVRVWMGPWVPAGSGGIHVAPAIGARNAIAAEYRLQWLTIFEGYAVDATAGILFLLSSIMMLCLIPTEPGSKRYVWLAIALALSGISRGNQAVLFWWEIETIRFFALFIAVLIGSLTLGAWLMAWRGWFRLDRLAWLPWAIAGMTALLFFARLLANPWLFNAEFSPATIAVLRDLVSGIRFVFLLALAWLVFLGLRRGGREGWFALPAVLASVAVLFTGELVQIGLPGIWFPWGIGVSLSEYASLALVMLLCVPVLRQLWTYGARAAPSLA